MKFKQEYSSTAWKITIVAGDIIIFSVIAFIGYHETATIRMGGNLGLATIANTSFGVLVMVYGPRRIAKSKYREALEREANKSRERTA